MKRIIYTLIAFTTLYGCNTQESPEALKAKLAKLKEQSIKLNHQIKDLESRIARMDTLSNGNGYVKVVAETLTPSPFYHYFTASGKVELENEASISPETNGQVKRIHVSKGQRVRKGDLLISLNTSIIESSIAEVKIALELATSVYEKQKNLWEQNIGSELQYLQAKNQKESLEQKLRTLNAQLDMSLIKAPFDGIVDDIYIKEGELASPGRAVAYMLNTEKLKIDADISESILNKVHVGDKVRIEFPTFPELSIEAPVFRIGNMVDPKTRTVKVEIHSTNPKGAIKPNQIAMLFINDYYNPEALSVPSIILKRDTKGTFLFKVEKTDSKYVATKVYVETGVAYNDRTVITKGLSAGDRVIVSGYNMVSNGVPVQLTSK